MVQQQESIQERIAQIKSTRATPRVPREILEALDRPIEEQNSKASTDAIPRYYKPMSVGRVNLSKERIRQIENIALRKFSRELLKRGLTYSDLIG